MSDTADILIVGGGVIGLSLAYELAGQGTDVVVLEQGQFGREASWAGAGILPPGNPVYAVAPEALLRAHSHVLWPALSERLRDETGIDNGYRVCGGIEVTNAAGTAALAEDVHFWQNEHIPVEALDAEALRRCEPKLSRHLSGGYCLPGMGQVRNPWHLKALFAACAARGVRLSAGRPVVGFDRRAGRIASVCTPTESFAAGKVCVAGGAWSRQILATVGCDVAVEPVRGQIVLLSSQPPPFRHVINCGSRYLVPRPDGRILIGSTEERVGFDKRNSAGAVTELIDFAIDLVPALADARFEQAWSGLRPGSPTGLPYLGLVPGLENLYVSAGHFRSGLQMSPATAVVMRQLLLGQPTLFRLEPFAISQ